MNIYEIIIVLFLPFLGTGIGAGLIFFAKNNETKWFSFLQSISVGIMIGVTIISLLIPLISDLEMKYDYYNLLIALVILIVTIFIACFDLLLKRFKSSLKLKNSILLFFAIFIHNIPEGFIVGSMSLNQISAALTLSIAIAVQNIPESYMVATCFYLKNVSRKKSFILALLSGAIEPICALVAVYLGKLSVDIIVYMHLIALGAMLYVSYEFFIELEKKKETSFINYFGLIAGFIIMLFLEK